MTRKADDKQLVLYHVHIHMSDNEYQGQHRADVNSPWELSTNADGSMRDNMKMAAREVFDAHPDKPNMVAEVWEHGGWHLSFFKDENMTIVGTANDTASLSVDAHKIGDRFKGCKHEFLPEVWRGRSDN